ncbi:hypothetical protein BH10CYA1_BH10CYA1_03560 [soil metagenome]
MIGIVTKPSLAASAFCRTVSSRTPSIFFVYSQSLSKTSSNQPGLRWANSFRQYDADFTEEQEEENPFGLDLCPDFLHKADISGGSPYTVYIPATTPKNKLDPLVNFDDMSAMPFIQYLRHCFKWGGFPGLAVMELEDSEIDLNRRMPFKNTKGTWREAAQNLLVELRRDVIPF